VVPSNGEEAPLLGCVQVHVKKINNAKLDSQRQE
jgi:hypothetical protein